MSNGYSDTSILLLQFQAPISRLKIFVFASCCLVLNTLLFVLTCKYLKPLYLYVKDLRRKNLSTVDEKVDSALLFSVVITAIVIIIGIIVEGYVAGGICISVPHIILICIMIVFSFVQFIFVCCKLCKKRSTEIAQNQHSVLHDKIKLTDYTVLHDKITLKMAEVVDTIVCFKDRQGEDVTVDCNTGSDGTASLEANLQYAPHDQLPPATFTMESKNKITLKMFREADEDVGITFKDTNNVKCVVGSDNLECNLQCAQCCQFTSCTVLQDMIILKIAGPANKNVDVSFKDTNNKVSTIINCVIGSDGTATLVGNFQRPHFTGCTVSQGKITLEIDGPAKKKFDISFKDINHEVSIVECAIGLNGKATLEGNFQPTDGSNYFKEFPISCHCNSQCCENNCACKCTCTRTCKCICTCTEKVCTYTTKAIILWLLYSLPHVVFYFLTLLVFNFFLNPISYLVILEYLAFSVVVLWTVNAVSLAKLFTCCFTCCCNGQRTCTKKIKGLLNMVCMSILTCVVAVTANLIYIFGWNIVNAFFNDKRPRASDILRLIPILVASLLGWYSKDNLLKVFTKLLPKQLPPSAENQLPPSTENQLPPSTENQLPPSTENQLPPATENQLPPSTENQLPPSTENQLPPATENQLPPSTENQLPPATENQLPPSTENQLPPATETESTTKSPTTTRYLRSTQQCDYEHHDDMV